MLVLKFCLGLGIAVISFHIPSAMGQNISPYKTKEAFNVSPAENRPDTATLNQKDKIEPSLVSWSKIQDIAEYLFSRESDEKVKFQIKSLQRELKVDILLKNLSTFQIIDLLKKKILEKAANPYKQSAAVRIMREFLNRYPLPDNSKVLQIISFLKQAAAEKKINPQARNNTFQSAKKAISQQPENLNALSDIIQLIGELSITYLLPPIEVLKISKFLQKQLALQQTDIQIQLVIIQAIGEILEKYNLSESQYILQMFSQIKEYLFHQDIRIRQAALLVTVTLLKTGEVPDTEKQTLIPWITNHLNDKQALTNRIAALVILNEFLKQDIVSDPEDKQKIADIALKKFADPHPEVRKAAVTTAGTFLIQKDILSDPDEKRKIVFMIADRITDPNKDVQIEVIITLSSLITRQDILPDPNDRREVTFMIVNRFTDPNENEEVQKAAITAAGSLAQQDILSDIEDRREITSIIVDRITDPNARIQRAAIAAAGPLITSKSILPDRKKRRKITWTIVDLMIEPNGTAQKEAVKTMGFLLNQSSILSDSEKSDIVYKIIMLLLDDTQSTRTRRATATVINSLLASDLLFLEKIKIIQLLTEEFSSVTQPQVRVSIFNIFIAAKKADLPLDFFVFDKVADMVSEPSPVGNSAEEFIRTHLKETTLSNNPETDSREKMMIYLKMEKNLDKNPASAQKEPNQNTACQNSMR